MNIISNNTITQWIDGLTEIEAAMNEARRNAVPTSPEWDRACVVASKAWLMRLQLLSHAVADVAVEREAA
jgi:hypothetical protein